MLTRYTTISAELRSRKNWSTYTYVSKSIPYNKTEFVRNYGACVEDICMQCPITNVNHVTDKSNVA